MKHPFKLKGHSFAVAILRLPLPVLLVLCLGTATMAQTRVIKNVTIYNGNIQSPKIQVLPVTAIRPMPGQSVRLFYGVTNGGCSFTSNLVIAQNYLLTTTPRVKRYFPGGTACNVMQSVQYLDGLGRPLQTVQVRASADSAKDVVQPIAYDQFGREATKYLPYATTDANGSYRADALALGAGVYNYYKLTNAGVDGLQQSNGVVTNSYPYSKTVFEASPLNRAVEQGYSGAPWQPGAGHTTGVTFDTNAANEVTKWIVTGNGVGATGNNSYVAGRLYKTTTSDENNNKTVEYKDKNDHVICRKVQADNSGTYYATYYVYNAQEQLSYVIPQMRGTVPNTFTEAAVDTAFNGYIYGYHYDSRGRMDEKKIPGKGWEHLVYNTLDQIVATQDSVQRQTSKYTFTRYDGLGRVIMTGEVTDSRGHRTIANDIAEQTYNWEITASTGTGYTNQSYPNAPSNVIYTINYYDNYSYPGAGTFTATTAGIITNVTGLLTGSKVNILGETTMLLSKMYYDDNGRMVESVAQNHMAGNDRVVNEYNFSNQIIKSIHTHNSSTVTGLNIVTEYAYDHMGRKTTTKEQIGNGSQVILSQLDYNDIGQLKTKHLGNDAQQVNYAYNERGWLKTANASLFTMKLNYSEGTAPQWNGNIAQMLYTGPSSGSKTFNYSYDNLSRLTNAQYTGGALNEQLKYDPLGNIQSLTRGSYGSLNYTYNGSRLVKVTGYSPRNYAYDGNGNATSDGSNKFIQYNYLNVPKAITLNNTTIAIYTYDATGQKLKNTGSDGNWDYISGIVYHNNTMAFVSTEVGRATYSNGNYNYEYNLQDQLGNNRVSFKSNNGTAQVLQEDEYYSFGLCKNLFGATNGNHYLYNGKEIQNDLKDQYDYGARFYDPVIGRWTSVDPLAEISRKYSPYNYVENNPLRNIDPDGMWTETATGYSSDSPEEAQAFFNTLQAKKNPPLEKSKSIIRDATAISSKVPLTQPKIKSNFGLANFDIPPSDQGSINSYPPPEEVNYQDFGLRTTSLTIATSVLDTYGAVAGAAELKTIFWGVNAAVNGETAATKLGRAWHAIYKSAETDGIVTFKEFTGIKGIRPDFVDFGTKTIYELKPNNARAIKQGLNQLNKYKSLFESKYGGTWKIVLDHY